MLRMLGYVVIAARDAEEAATVAAAHPEPIHLLLTDVIMPGTNGAQLAVALQQRTPDLKVLFMSGYTRDIIAREGVLDSGLHFVQKPFSIFALANAVRKVLDA
jgi:CheY-like chemotaxis protein